ncbi:hypothetical protein Nepgr_002474 [Nepenthes gracilis]|uniref:AATF leucine zipper-containing domain-containing protein n=1 Tax=Nepenthes gracilis TaxID=150966 RepID=A0AAD3RYG3_NEPGR|nr:hypothetical protein Nepgr_002474 [Nepenthes gracilis]
MLNSQRLNDAVCDSLLCSLRQSGDPLLLLLAGKGQMRRPRRLFRNLVENLKHHKDEDLLKGQAAVKNQKALWDKFLEIRFLLQKAFTNSNRLPQSKPCIFRLIASSETAINSLLELQEVLVENNPLITQGVEGNSEPSLMTHRPVIIWKLKAKKNGCGLLICILGIMSTERWSILWLPNLWIFLP